MASQDDRTMTAVFPKVAHAKEFVDGINDKGRSATAGEAWHYVPGSVKQSGRTVTWQWSGAPSDGHPEGSRNAFLQYLRDMLETVGYYGSAPVGPKATLNGHRAPTSY